jgi:hypothetical protein
MSVAFPVLEEVVAGHVRLVPHRDEHRDAESAVDGVGRIASPAPPDWDTNPTFPLTGIVAANVASSLTLSLRLTTPMQFGPIIRMR